MFLACLRGLIPKGPPKQRWLSDIRTELVLTHLASEIDAEYLGNAVSMTSNLASGLPIDAVKDIVDDLQDRLIEISRLREICAPKATHQATAGSLSLEAMAKIYEGMKQSGFLAKKST